MDGKFKIFLNYINEKTHSRAYSQRPDQMSNLCRLPPRVALSVRTTTTFLWNSIIFRDDFKFLQKAKLY